MSSLLALLPWRSSTLASAAVLCRVFSLLCLLSCLKSIYKSEVENERVRQRERENDTLLHVFWFSSLLLFSRSYKSTHTHNDTFFLFAVCVRRIYVEY